MKVSLAWLSKYCDISDILKEQGATKLAHTYSIQTAEIDAVETFGQEDRVIVGKVVSAAAHPDSDHLNVVQVNLGSVLGIVQIVCGAANVVDANFVAVATPGSILGEGFEIKVSKIRGVESNGMICSDDELGLASERSTGIMRLDDFFSVSALERQLGKSFFGLEVEIPGIGSTSTRLTLKDTIFEIDNKFITNRPDLFSVLGNAREMSAIFDRSFVSCLSTEKLSGNTLNVKIESKGVLAYHLVRLENVQTSLPHFGMKSLLQRSGLSSKFDLVDITNIVMTELGQPMHVFDADKITGIITVRQAKNNETMEALNGEKYTLTSEDIVIADDREILAIAGIIGGMSSAVSESTKNICFESACFDAATVRQTSTRIGLRTDSLMRFEKSLDPLLAESAMLRALDMLTFLGKKGSNQQIFSYLDNSRVNNLTITTDIEFIERKLGTPLTRADIEKILIKLGFGVTFMGNSFTVKVPSWRATKDISIKEDIAEEIGRIYGYDKIIERPIQGNIEIAVKNPSILLKNAVIDYFASKGLFEAYNYSFTSLERDIRAGFTDTTGAIEVLNAWSKDVTHMRRSLIPHLFVSASENTKSSDNFGFFELGKIFLARTDSDFLESKALAGVVYGKKLTEVQAILSGFISSLLPRMKYELIQDKSEKPHLHPGKSGMFVVYGNKPLVTFGFIHPEIASTYGLDDSKTLIFEIDFTLLSEIYTKSDYKFTEISKFPGVTRELNFVFAKNIPVGDVVKKITKTSNLVSSPQVVDIFEDNVKVGQGLRSVTFSFELRDTTKTITDEEALSIQQKIIATLERDGIKLRGK